MFEDKYNVLLLNPAKVTFDKENLKYVITQIQVKLDGPACITPLDYEYVVVGQRDDVKNAIEGIKKMFVPDQAANSTLSKEEQAYEIVTEAFPAYLPGESFQRYLEKKKDIMKNTGTYFFNNTGQITYLGRPDDINDVKQAILSFASKPDRYKHELDIGNNELTWFIRDRYKELNKITKSHNVEANI